MPEGLDRLGLVSDTKTAAEMGSVETLLVGNLSNYGQVQASATLAKRNELESHEVVVDWRSLAYCRPPAEVTRYFYPPSDGERKDEKLIRESQAKMICANCKVSRACLDFALRNNEKEGIWGGMTPDERRALRTKQ